MALLPARRGGTVTRPGSQTAGRWDPLGEYWDAGTRGRALRRVRRTGWFEFRVMLPGKADPDKITAALADGVPTVTVPKAETDKPLRIEVTGG
jgi:HSP20 family protein